MGLSEKFINEVIKNDTPLQNRLIIAIIYYCAASSKEIMYVSFDDIDIRNKAVKIGARKISVPGIVITMVCEHIAKTGYRRGPLFRTKLGYNLKFRDIRNTVEVEFNKLWYDRMKSDIGALLREYDFSGLSPAEFIDHKCPLITPIIVKKSRGNQWKKFLVK